MTKFRALLVSSLLAATVVAGTTAATTGVDAKPAKAPTVQKNIWCC
jgi:hypothetical protein